MRRITTGIALIALIGSLAMVGLMQAQAQEDVATEDHQFVGSWLVSMSLENEEPGASLSPELTSLVTIFADGNVVVANAGQLPPLPPGSGLFFTAGHGQWVASGESTADMSTVSLVLDQTGVLSDTVTARMSVEIDAEGDAFTGSFRIVTTASTGTTIPGAQGTLEATRIQVEAAGA